ncbi:exported hypothetical protein [Tenacibaculum sp. 190524A02b]|uniref:Lipoprotein n=1 Tax=Tenacibaculum vairaonense TaxID=3137860 RepID=A0ABM9PSK4_9FLAO
MSKSINFSLLLILSLIFYSCNNDDEIVNVKESSSILPVNKVPKYNNGIFFISSELGIDSKINFFNIKDNSFEEIYSSKKSHIASIDGDNNYYYISSQRVDDSGSNSVIVKDLQTFKDVRTITTNLNFPKKVISFSDKLFIVNNDDPNLLDTKPFISVFTKTKTKNTFIKKIDLPENTRAEKMKVLGNKLYIVSRPPNFLLSQSIIVFNLQNEQIEANITNISNFKPDIDDLESYEDNMYFSIKPRRGIFTSNPKKREIYKFSGTKLNLAYEITNPKNVGETSIMLNYRSNFYITSGKFIYKQIPGNKNLELTYTNNKIFRFLHFLTSTEVLILDTTNKLTIKKINDSSEPKKLIDFINRDVNSIELFKL